MDYIITQIQAKWKVPVFLALVASAFFLGRTFKFLENKPGFTYSQNSTLEKPFTGGGSVHTETVVASRGGKKYYLVWCKGAENIKEKNKRYFANEELAKKAGYEKAASCK
jgi:hypothetical protein